MGLSLGCGGGCGAEEWFWWWWGWISAMVVMGLNYGDGTSIAPLTPMKKEAHFEARKRDAATDNGWARRGRALLRRLFNLSRRWPRPVRAGRGQCWARTTRGLSCFFLSQFYDFKGCFFAWWRWIICKWTRVWSQIHGLNGTDFRPQGNGGGWWRRRWSRQRSDDASLVSFIFLFISISSFSFFCFFSCLSSFSSFSFFYFFLPFFFFFFLVVAVVNSVASDFFSLFVSDWCSFSVSSFFLRAFSVFFASWGAPFNSSLICLCEFEFVCSDSRVCVCLCNCLWWKQYRRAIYTHTHARMYTFMKYSSICISI